MYSNNTVVSMQIGCMIALTLACTGCAPAWWKDAMNGSGGGQDAVTVQLPFDATYRSTCVQGAFGSYSHLYSSTLWDVDLDTPNDKDDLVYAPIGGIARVHNDLTSGFGKHVNIDLGDGTYITLDHLESIFVEDSEEVAAGQMLGFEGTTGDSQGDHVHMGRHVGDAFLDAGAGESVEGLIFEYVSASTGAAIKKSTAELQCDLVLGEVMESSLATSRWHPSGSLVMTPYDSAVYVIEDAVVRGFTTEDVFWSYNYSFGDVVMISPEELNCYQRGDVIALPTLIEAIQDSGEGWLVVGAADDVDRYKQRLSDLEMGNVLRSWGLSALESVESLPSAGDVGVVLDDYSTVSGTAHMRDGTLVSEEGETDVYVISEGIAMPIVSWDVFLLMDFFGREIYELNNGSVEGLHDRVGNCTTDTYCVSREDALTCGGVEEDVWQVPASDDESISEVDTDADSGTGADADTGVDVDTLRIVWTAPSVMDRITLSGEYTESVGGYSSGWQSDMLTNWSVMEIVYDFYGAQPYDAFRFSVEFQDASTTSWSCIAPFPPGALQGSVQAFYGSVEVPVVATAAPLSDGCELFVEVP
jgi:hypothetical protein